LLHLDLVRFEVEFQPSEDVKANEAAPEGHGHPTSRVFSEPHNFEKAPKGPGLLFLKSFSTTSMTV